MRYGRTKHPIIIRNLSETRINFIRKISNSVRFLRNLCDNCDGRLRIILVLIRQMAAGTLKNVNKGRYDI